MKTCEATVALYEQRTKGKESDLDDRMQVWVLKGGAYKHSRLTPTWPDAYNLVGILDTHSLFEALDWTSYWFAWISNGGHLFKPWGEDTLPRSSVSVFVVPRPTTVGDVLVTPKRVAYVIQDIGFRRLVELPTPSGLQANGAADSMGTQLMERSL